MSDKSRSDRQREAGSTPDSTHSSRPRKGSVNQVRRRISRACDQCNQLRTKCDGKFPCAHCVEFGLTCEYARERKKRGKASRKDLAAQKAAPTNGASQKSDDSPQSSRSESEPPLETRSGVKRRRSDLHDNIAPRTLSNDMNATTSQTNNPAIFTPSHMYTAPLAQQPTFDRGAPVAANPSHYQVGAVLSSSNVQNHNLSNNRLPFSAGDFSSMDDYHRNVLQRSAAVNGQHILHPTPSLPTFGVASPGSRQGAGVPEFRIGDSPLSGELMGNSPYKGSPSWLDLPSPSAGLYPNMQQNQSQQGLRYPVLAPILPRILPIIPLALACDLLDIYFASSSSAFVQPASPYILGFVLRKRSVLRQTDPRPCSRALLASMLWVGAQTSENAFLTSPPSQRGKVCHHLLDLTIALLKPLVHAESNRTSHVQSSVNGVALGGFGVANPAAGHDTEGGSTGAAASLDDVITYINLATVVSASEYKAASLRWWNAAWSLARELKLGRELPPNPGSIPDPLASAPRSDGERQAGAHAYNRPGSTSEEEREERRRIWWLLYTVDRHLALCYNRPLFLLDVECDSLLQPENETVFQAGEYYPAENYEQSLYFRRRGPCFECTGHGIFGYFLPLMTILGEIVNINHAKNHPRFGIRSRPGQDWDDQISEINSQLECYGRSLKDFEARFIPDANGGGADGLQNLNSPSAAAGGTRMTEAVLQTRIVIAYGTHLMHTLHILVNGKWDPISLLDDNDLWISSQSFISATGHAVSAAEAISDILEYDPDLSFMPFFFGIYLLQGSFLLLLIADKLQGEASPSVVKACEAIVRAHEVCVVTLNTEYQRNFRKVMRSALAQVKGRLPEDFGEQQQRRREVLALYRWTGDGQGLAL